MYKGKRIVGLITARGGSKGIPGKNIQRLGGKPLISWTIEAGKGSQYLDRLILSSDDKKIIEIANELGCEVPFIRPSNLANDQTPSMDVIMHALNSLDAEYDCLVLLQPTSPFRTSEHIDKAIREAIDTDSKMLVSVSKAKKHPVFLYEIDDSSHCLKKIFGKQENPRRQDAPSAYEHNGAIYFSEVSYLRKKKSYITDEVRAFVMDQHSSLDIDEPEDIEYAGFLISKGYIE